MGRVLHSARAIRMERDRMIAFAEEFDPQPAHLSEEQPPPASSASYAPAAGTPAA